MKLNLKILKAINEGIRKSLLSFDDVLFDKTKSASMNSNVGKTIEDWQLIQDGFVDLGLPSGTLWMTNNIGATCGDNAESWYGNYYMYGSTTKNNKTNCDWKNTPFNNNKKDFSKSYFMRYKNKFIDDYYCLLPDFDIAHKLNNKLHIPTMRLILELIDNTSSKWIYDYNGVVGLNGILYIGNNNNTLFIPASGYKNGTLFEYKSTHCYLWSNTVDKYYPTCAGILWGHDTLNCTSRTFRSKGCPARGVTNKN